MNAEITAELDALASGHPALRGALDWVERTGNGIFPLHSYEDNRCTCSDLSCSSPGKHPRTASGFKEATADRVQIRAWVRQWPGCNWGGVTAGLVVVDLDGSRGADGWAALVDEHGETPTLTHRTGRGRHLIYRQNGTKVSNSASKIADSVDIRADGGYIVLPGSLHPSGRLYETEQAGTVVEAPRWLVVSATAPRSTATSSTDGPRPGRLGEAIPYGAHDDTLFKYACLLRSRNVDKVEAYALIEQRRRDCQNGGPSEVAGFTAEAARAKVDEVWGRYPAGRGGDGDKPSGGKGPSQATQLVNLALERYDLGQTDEGEPFAVAKGGDVRIARMLRGAGGLRAELSALYFERSGSAPSNSGLADALVALEGFARRGEKRSVAYRVTRDEADPARPVVIDLGEEETGRAVVVRPGGWEVVSNAPVLFRRSALTKPLPTPERGGALDALRELLNVSDRDWALLVAFLVASLIPEIPHPVLLITGEHGTAKTGAMVTLVSLIDPSAAPTRATPRDYEQWVVAASGSWVIPLDNVSYIADWFSDAICKASTGDAMVRRTLYADRDLTVDTFRRVVIINGIDVGALRGDLGSRLLPLELQRITIRRTEKQVREALEQIRPAVVGALLDLLAQVLVVIPEVETPQVRMADFGQVLLALDKVCPDLGAWEAFERAQEVISARVIESDAVNSALLAFIEEQAPERNGVTTWEGSATALLERLGKYQTDKPRNWPSNGQVLSARLRRNAPDLRDQHGLDVVFHDPTKKGGVRLGRRVELRWSPDGPPAQQEIPGVTDPASTNWE